MGYVARAPKAQQRYPLHRLSVRSPPDACPHGLWARICDSSALLWRPSLRSASHRQLTWRISYARKACGMGPGLVFATRLLCLGAAARVGLVPCAVGGTEMDRWMPDGDLYAHMVRPRSLCRGRLLCAP